MPVKRKSKTQPQRRQKRPSLLLPLSVLIVLLISIFIVLFTVSQPLHAQSAPSIEDILKKILEVMSGGTSDNTQSICDNLKKSNASQQQLDDVYKQTGIDCNKINGGNGNGDSGSTGSGSEIADIKAYIAGLNLPAPDQAGATQALQTLLGDSSWATEKYLNAEKKLKSDGVPIQRYLTTAWIWFESGGAGPDPYEINCQNMTSEVSFRCPISNFQIGGWQVGDRKNQIVEGAKKCNSLNSDADYVKLLQQIVDDSDKAKKPGWRYKDNGQQTGLVSQYAPGGTVPTTVEGVNVGEGVMAQAGGDIIDNGRAQFYTLLLGKDPCTGIYLNSKAVTSNFAAQLAAASDSNKLYGYIGDANKQKIVNYMAALWMFDSGKDNIDNTSTVTTTPPPSDANKLDKVAYWAEQIKPNIVRGTVCGMMCRNVTALTGNGITSQYREGNDDTTSQSGRYWCTTIVKDSVAMADGAKNDLSESVLTMMQQWQDKGWPYYAYYQTSNRQNVIENIKRGCAMFQFSGGNHHASVVTGVTVDASGNGTIDTVEADAPKTSKSYAVASWNVKNLYYSNLAFGCF